MKFISDLQFAKIVFCIALSIFALWYFSGCKSQPAIQYVIINKDSVRISELEIQMDSVRNNLFYAAKRLKKENDSLKFCLKYYTTRTKRADVVTIGQKGGVTAMSITNNY